MGHPLPPKSALSPSLGLSCRPRDGGGADTGVLLSCSLRVPVVRAPQHAAAAARVEGPPAVVTTHLTHKPLHANRTALPTFWGCH